MNIVYVRVCACAWAWEHAVANEAPAGWTQRDLSPWEGEGGRGVGVTVRHDQSCPTGGAPKPVRHDRSWQLRPACPQFIFLTRAMLSVLPFGKHDSGTQAKYPGSKCLLYN